MAVRVIDRNPPKRKISRPGVVVAPPPDPDPVEGIGDPPLDAGSGTAYFAAPTNLRWQPQYDQARGGSCGRFTWDAPKGAQPAEYKLYRNLNPVVVATIPGSQTHYDMPASETKGWLHYIKAYGSTHEEQTLPTNWCEAHGLSNPALNHVAYTPATPNKLYATPEWQGDGIDDAGQLVPGYPRTNLVWACQNGQIFRVYRDGVLVADGLTIHRYIDNNPTLATHTYQVQAGAWSSPGNNFGPGGAVTWGPISSSVSATTRTTKRPFQVTPIPINKTIGFHDGMMVFFPPVATAMDYAVEVEARPGSYKYAGNFHLYSTSNNAGGKVNNENNDGAGVSIYVPGLVEGDRVRVYAMDKLGPFYLQPKDAHRHAGFTFSTNGHGDPSNIPYPVAMSDWVDVVLDKITVPAGGFFTSFEGLTAASVVPIPTNQIHPDFLLANTGQVQGFDTPHLKAWFVLCDEVNSQIFLHHSAHGMDITVDGAPEYSGPLHTNNAGLVLEWKHVIDLTGGKAAVLFFDVSPFMTERSWWELQLHKLGSQILNPGKFAETNLRPSTLCDLFRWQIKPSSHILDRFLPPPANSSDPYTRHYYSDTYFGELARTSPNTHYHPKMNGTPREIDKPNRFRITISKTKIRIEEIAFYNDHPEYSLVAERTMAPGDELPDYIVPYLVHQVYHSALKVSDATGSSLTVDAPAQPNPQGLFEINLHLYDDEGHWDNFYVKPFPSYAAALASLG